MDLDRERRLFEILRQVLAEEPHKRRARLDRVCQGDLALREEAEACLACADEAEARRFLGTADAPFACLSGEEAPPWTPPQPGEWIGSFRVARMLGAGGMGAVFLAEQETPIRRQAAVKIVKPSGDAAELARRFQRERETLAAMRHPYIAQVFEAGETPAGAPYLAMEYIEGLPITEHCDRRRLSIRARFQLFLKVCEGAAYAHRQGVIHRDFKPSNILTTRPSEGGVPKIIDFGIARLTGDPADWGCRGMVGGAERLTRCGAVIGSVGYMSPEQSVGDAVDTRTDVYALGAILYETLCGLPPLPIGAAHPAGGVGVGAAADPTATPGARVRQAGSAARRAAEARGLSVAGLARALRGEPSWIVAKAMARDKTRRYDSVSHLAADIQAYLTGRPLDAGPGGWLYPLRKWAARRKAAALAVVMAAFSLAAITGALILGLTEAQREAERAEAAFTLLSDMLIEANPEAMGRAATIAEWLARFEERLDHSAAAQPEATARLRLTAAGAYIGLGMFEPAADNARQALMLSESSRGADHPESLRALVILSEIQFSLGARREPLAGVERCVAGFRRALGPHHPETLGASLLLARMYAETNQVDKGLRVAKSVQRSLATRPGGRHPQSLDLARGVAHALISLGHVDEAEAMMAKTAETIARKRGRDDPEALFVLKDWAEILIENGEPERAAALCRERLVSARRNLGEARLPVVIVTWQMARAISASGMAGEAEAVLREVVQRLQRMFGDAHPYTLEALGELAETLAGQGRPAEAVVFMERHAAGCARLWGEDHPHAEEARRALAGLVAP